MAQPSAHKHSLPPPEITPVSEIAMSEEAKRSFANSDQADLEAFHKAHFFAPSVDHFSTHFLGPVPEYENQEGDEDDGLGYYFDGVKRTLTDEQVAMFRHSEIQALLRERRHAEENKPSPTREDEQAAEVEEGELEDDDEALSPAHEQTHLATKPGPPNGGAGNPRRQKVDQRKWKIHKQSSKPDLRKRTWDKVDRGLQSLDYGDEERGAMATPAAPQRRRISYEDV